MNIWQQLYEKAKKEFDPCEVSPFIYAHRVVCALESENGELYSGFCIESCGGIMDLCAERTAALNMYMDSGQTVVKRIIAFRNEPPKGLGGMPCGSCRELLLQFSPKNKDTQIMIDYQTKEIVTLDELVPNWWGWTRYDQS